MRMHIEPASGCHASVCPARASFGLRVDHARRQFEAAAVVPEDAVLLDMDAGRPICRVRTLAFAKGEPVEYSIARYRGDRNVFTVELYR